MAVATYVQWLVKTPVVWLLSKYAGPNVRQQLMFRIGFLINSPLFVYSLLHSGRLSGPWVVPINWTL